VQNSLRGVDVKHPTRRAGLPGKESSSFVKLTMTAHHAETGFVPGL
jgi:hypothetical protein